MDGFERRPYRWLEAHPIAGSLGAEIAGVDLGRELGDEVMGEIRRALLDHLVIFFRDQTLTPAQQVAFARRWGDIHYFPLSAGLDGYPEILEVKKTPEEGYHLSDDITDRAVSWIRDQHTGTPDRPFFAYVAYGATHAPHQVPEKFRGRHKGKFDIGWDKLREETLARQKKAGVAPADAKLASRPEGVKPWDQLTPDEMLVASRLMENYADFAEHVDWNVGRLVDALEELGVADDTVFLYQLGDNGMSADLPALPTQSELKKPAPSDPRRAVP